MSSAPSHWAKDSDEEDRVEALIRVTGCWDQHIAVVDCMGDKADWRQCQDQVQQFKQCMQKKPQQSKEKNSIMLSEIFANLEIDEPDINKERGQQCTPDQYLAENHHVGWFLSRHSSKDKKEEEDDRELAFYRAVYFYHHKKYEEAFQEYKRLFTEYKHSRTHSIAVIDSLVRCALKMPSFSQEELLNYLHEYEQCALNYGDQLQYLNVKKDVYADLRLPDASQQFVDTVCLLCASVDLPEHWLAFGQRSSLNVGNNFRLGYMTRAILLLEHHIKHAHGFVCLVLSRKAASLNNCLAKVESPDRICEARRKMSIDMNQHDDIVQVNEQMHCPAHDTRSKVEVYKTAHECIEIVRCFKYKYSWMFEGC